MDSICGLQSWLMTCTYWTFRNYLFCGTSRRRGAAILWRHSATSRDVTRSMDGRRTILARNMADDDDAIKWWIKIIKDCDAGDGFYYCLRLKTTYKLSRNRNRFGKVLTYLVEECCRKSRDINSISVLYLRRSASGYSSFFESSA